MESGKFGDGIMYCIIANVISDNVLRKGAKVYILTWHGDAEHPQVIGLARDGRKVRKYTAFKRLMDFRASWVPDHIRPECFRYWETKKEAQKVADSLNEYWCGVRAFDKHGHQVKDGVSENERRRS